MGGDGGANEGIKVPLHLEMLVYRLQGCSQDFGLSEGVYLPLEYQLVIEEGVQSGNFHQQL